MIDSPLKLPAQNILTSSDLEVRVEHYKSEFENRSLYKNQITLSNTGQTYDVVYYKLEFDIGIDPNSFAGRATERFISQVDSLSEIDLDFDSYLTVDRVSGAAISHQLDGYSLNLTLDKAYHIGDTIEVIIEYQGIPRSEGDDAGFWFGIHREGPGDPAVPVIFTNSQPYGARSWWPCKDDPADKPDSMDIIITIPDIEYNGHKLYAVSNGSLLSIINNDNETRTFHWYEKYPIATYLVSLAISNYQIYNEWFVTSQNDSMPVIYYIYPERLDDALADYDSTLDMIETYSNIFTLYPFFEEKYGMAHYGRGAAMEHQTVSSMGLTGFWIVAHELAHQWFGNLVTCADYHHIWLNEGWATYMEALYSERLYGSDGYHTYMNAIAYYGVEKSIYVTDPLTDPIFDTVVYEKAAWVLHMLRFVMGDNLFFSAVRGYLNDQQFQYNSATTSDFQSKMEQYYGSSLDWFFQQWIFGKGYPWYQYSWTYDQIDDQYHINLSLDQIQSQIGIEEVFTMPLDVVIMQFPHLAGDTVQIWNDSRQQTFEIITTLEPATVELDPKNWILKKSEEVLWISKNRESNPYTYKLEQNYPNPFNPRTKINYQLSMFGDVELSVYNILGQKIVTLIAEKQAAGSYQVEWNASTYPTGIYYYILRSGSYTAFRKMALLK